MSARRQDTFPMPPTWGNYWLWFKRAPAHRILWIVILTGAAIVRATKFIICCGRRSTDRRFEHEFIEEKAASLANDSKEVDAESQGLRDHFHRQALDVVVPSLLTSEIKHLTYVLPYAHMLEKKLRIERAVAAARSRLASREPLPEVFIVGLPRTGSTALHNALGTNAYARCIRAWEFKSPLKLSNTPDPSREARIEQTQKVLAGFYKFAPAIKAIHYIRALDPDECVQGFNDLAFPEYYLWGAVTAQGAFDWYVEQDMSSQYSNYRKVLDVVLAESFEEDEDKTHLVLKSPHHTFKLKEIVHVFPNAKFVWLHRDPVNSVGSCCSMNQALLDVTSPSYVDPKELGARTLERLALAVEKAMRDRDEIEKQSKVQFVDVGYRRFMANPKECMRGLYRELGFTAPVFAPIDANAANEETTSKHAYTLDHFGLSEAIVNARFKEYSSRFKDLL